MASDRHGKLWEITAKSSPAESDPIPNTRGEKLETGIDQHASVRSSVGRLDALFPRQRFPTNPRGALVVALDPLHYWPSLQSTSPYHSPTIPHINGGTRWPLE